VGRPQAKEVIVSTRTANQNHFCFRCSMANLTGDSGSGKLPAKNSSPLDCDFLKKVSFVPIRCDVNSAERGLSLTLDSEFSSSAAQSQCDIRVLESSSPVTYITDVKEGRLYRFAMVGSGDLVNSMTFEIASLKLTARCVPFAAESCRLFSGRR